MESPILGIQLDTEKVRLLRVSYSEEPTPQPNLEELVRKMNAGEPIVLEGRPTPSRLKIEIQSIEPSVEVSSLEQAEDLFITRTLANSNAVFCPQKVCGTGQFTIADTYAALSVLINRGANLIASRTRRGAGNVVLMHPDDVRYLRIASTSAFASGSFYNTGETIGRWTREGTLNSSLEVYSGPVTKNKIIVLYKGRLTSDDGTIARDHFDAPCVYSTFNGKHYATFLENTISSLGNFEDYTHVITIEDNGDAN